MLNEKKQQAKNLYFQTELTKTQIATLLGISRRSLHYWIKEENWDRLRESATHLPSLLAEKCYHIFGHLTDKYLSELRATNPLSPKEADTLHKLMLTIGKLKNRSTLNENIELFAYFLDGLKKQDPQLALQIAPHIDNYLHSRASVYTSQLAPAHYNTQGYIPLPETNYAEQQLDIHDLFDWDNEQMDALDATTAQSENISGEPAEPGESIEPQHAEPNSEPAETYVQPTESAECHRELIERATFAQNCATIEQQITTPNTLTH